MSHNPLLAEGQDAEAIAFTPAGELIVTWSDGTQTRTPANDDLAIRIRAKGFATHKFLTNRRRTCPIPRT